MSLRASLLLAAIAIAGCTRLNGAFLDGDAETDTAETDAAPTSGADPTRAIAEGSSSTTGDGSGTPNQTESGLTTGDPTGSPTDPEGSSGGDACLEVVSDGPGCDPYSADTCDQGQCRPYGEFGDLNGVGCVRQDRAPLLVGASCSHSCAGRLGKDACAERSICDPFSDAPVCVRLCDGNQKRPSCPGDFSCFSHVAGRDSYGICRPGCNPLGTDCPGGQTCVPNPDAVGFHCVTPAGNAPVGEGCEFVNGCAAGLLCLDTDGSGCSGSSGCCASPCSVDLDDCPNEDEVCESLLVGVGVCVD